MGKRIALDLVYRPSAKSKGKSVMQPNVIDRILGLPHLKMEGAKSCPSCDTPVSRFDVDPCIPKPAPEPQASPLAAISVPKATKLASARKAPQKPSKDVATPKAKRNRNPYMKKFMSDKRAKEKAEKMANAVKA